MYFEIETKGIEKAAEQLDRFVYYFLNFIDKGIGLVFVDDVEVIKYLVGSIFEARLAEIEGLPPKYTEKYAKWKAWAANVEYEVPVESGGGTLPITYTSTGQATGFMLETLAKQIQSGEFSHIEDEYGGVVHGLMEFKFDLDVFYRRYPGYFNEWLKGKYGLVMLELDEDKMELVLNKVFDIVLGNIDGLFERSA